MSETLDIQLLGKDYRVACTSEEKASLVAAVGLLQNHLTAYREKTRSSGERLALMVALELAHELVNDRAVGDYESSIDTDKLRRTISSIEARITAALEPNDSLF